MGYASFAQAKQWVAPGFGECSPAKLADIVNQIRQEWYLWYESLPLFLDAVECFQVHRFCLDCNTCQDSYLGVTLPRDFQTVEAMWWNDFPVTLQSSWREFQTGLSPECGCGLDKYDIPGSFSTAVDLRPNHPMAVRVIAMDAADNGKRFVVRGTDAVMRPNSAEFALSTDPQQSTIAFRSIEPRGGVIKAETVGRVILANEEGAVLGIYEPGETVPSYKRIKITGLPDSCSHVNIRAARRYYPLHNDDDVVEVDNQPAFDAMARYMRIFKKADKTNDDLRNETAFLAKAKLLMGGDRSREVGKATRAEVMIASPNFGGRRLNRTR